MPKSIPLAAFCLLLLGTSGALADPPAAIAKPRFEQFCSSWMKKLRVREQANLASAQIQRKGDLFVLEYTGYSPEALRCESRATGVPSNPFVGKLVYQELVYQKSAGRREALRKAKARVLTATEILEIFRFDGARWHY